MKPSSKKSPERAPPDKGSSKLEAKNRRPTPAEATEKLGEQVQQETGSPNAGNSKRFPIVGIGASAGGLEAFTQLLQNLPPDTGMGFVLVQHLDPAHASALTQLLSKVTPLPVQEVTNDLPVEGNHVYVIAQHEPGNDAGSFDASAPPGRGWGASVH